MTITSTTLTRASGVAAAVAGLLFIGVQISHPTLDAEFATTTEYTFRESVKILMQIAERNPVLPGERVVRELRDIGRPH